MFVFTQFVSLHGHLRRRSWINYRINTPLCGIKIKLVLHSATRILSKHSSINIVCQVDESATVQPQTWVQKTSQGLIWRKFSESNRGNRSEVLIRASEPVFPDSKNTGNSRFWGSQKEPVLRYKSPVFLIFLIFGHTKNIFLKLVKNIVFLWGIHVTCHHK